MYNILRKIDKKIYKNLLFFQNVLKLLLILFSFIFGIDNSELVTFSYN